MLRLERVRREIERVLTNRWITLRLDSWGIGLDGARLVANSLCDKENNITWLNLYGNGLGDDGVQVIADALVHPNNRVCVLGLWDNNISDEGAGILARVLEHSNCKLALLDLQDNKFTTVGVHSIMRAVKRRSSLETILLPNTIDSTLTIELRTVLRIANSQKCKLITALLSARHVPRLSANSFLRAFPKELVRMLYDMLGD